MPVELGKIQLQTKGLFTRTESSRFKSSIFMNLVGKSERPISASSKGIVPGYIGEMSRVIQGEDAYVIAAADLETIDSAI